MNNKNMSQKNFSQKNLNMIFGFVIVVLVVAISYLVGIANMSYRSQVREGQSMMR